MMGSHLYNSHQKAMAAERKRGEEYYAFSHCPIAWLDHQSRRAAKADLSAQAAMVEHRSIEFPGVRLVQNTILDRIQLLFDGKPEAETISLLKREAFRWSPREGCTAIRGRSAHGFRLVRMHLCCTTC